MAKTKDKVSDAASNAKPYLDRALHDEELRDERPQRVRICTEHLRRAGRQARRVGRRDACRNRQGHPGRAPLDDQRAAEGRRSRPGQEGAQAAPAASSCSSASCSASSSTRSPALRRASSCPTASSAAATTSRTRAAAATARQRASGLTGLEAGCCVVGSSSPPSPSVAVGAIARCSDAGSRPLADEMSLLCKRIAPAFGVRGVRGRRPAGDRVEADVLEPAPRVEVLRRVDRAVVAEPEQLRPGAPRSGRWYGVPWASPVLPTKPSTSPAFTTAPFTASGEYAERCA